MAHQTGLIVADRYGGAIIKQAEAQTLHTSRRKAVTIGFARCAAERLSRNLDAIALAQRPGLVIPGSDDQPSAAKASGARPMKNAD